MIPAAPTIRMEALPLPVTVASFKHQSMPLTLVGKQALSWNSVLTRNNICGAMKPSVENTVAFPGRISGEGKANVE
ncbi:hypothetical protein ACVWZX_004430 [Deinococcus sp. UYEF24]